MAELAKLVLAFVGMVVAGVAIAKIKGDALWFALLAVLLLGAAILFGILG